jgi:hypothetical protein
MTDFFTGLLPPIEIVPSSEARAIQYQPYIDPATQHIDPSTPSPSNAELSAYNELAYQVRLQHRIHSHLLMYES